jgi:hypothetical protein
MIIWISLLLLFISFSAKWIMDTLLFHYYDSVWSKLKEEYWNPAVSWDRKYEIKGNKLKKWLLKNPLVFLTDGYHLMQFIYINSYMIVIALNIGSDWISRIITFIIIRIVYSITNLIFYK